MDIRELEQIIRILKDNDVSEFELDDNGVKIRLSRGKKEYVQFSPTVHAVEATAPAASQSYFIPASAAPAAEEIKEATLPDNIVKVESPIVGTFYRKPSPEAEAFVAEGQMVKRGQTLCIIEAMKIMNEIESPCNGKVAKILLEDGQVVEYGEKLFLIDTAA